MEQQFEQEYKQQTSEEMNQIINARSVSKIEEEYLHWHERLKHASSADMEILIDCSDLPRNLRIVAKDTSLCMSRVFGKMRRN